MAINLPAFAEKDRPHMMREYSHWLAVSKIIYATKDCEFILRILHLELTTNKRPMIIKRLYSRFSRIRAEMERTDIDAFLEDAKDQVQANDLWHAWATLSTLVNTADIDTIKSMMLYERNNQNRAHILRRMYGHYTVKRRAKELEDLERWTRNGYRVSENQ